MPAHNHTSTKTVPMETCPGVEVVLKKMTEGRRIELRKLIGASNRRIREIIRLQGEIDKVEPVETRDMSKWLELQDEFDGIMVEQINPAWVSWGVKQINGLQVDGKDMGVEDWKDWPSGLVDEVVTEVRKEAELNGVERKNFELPTTSGGPVALVLKDSTAAPAENVDGGATEIAHSTSRIV